MATESEATLPATPPASIPPSKPVVKVINHAAYYSSPRTLKMFALVENVGSVPAEFIRVEFDYPNIEGRRSTAHQLVKTRVLEPGEIASVSHSVPAHFNTGIERTLEARVAEAKPSQGKPCDCIAVENLVVVQTGNYAGNYLSMRGTVVNRSNQGSGPFDLDLTYVNASGAPVETGVQNFPNGLSAGQSAAFTHTITQPKPYTQFNGVWNVTYIHSGGS